MPTLLSQMTLRQNLSRILTNTELDNNFINLANALDNFTFSGGNVKIGTGNATDSKFNVCAANPARGIIASFENSSGSGQTGCQLGFLQQNVAYWAIGQPAGSSAFSMWVNRYAGADGIEVFKANVSGLVCIPSNLTIGSNSDYGKLAVLAPSGFTSNVMIAGVSGVCNGFQLANDASNNLQMIFSNKDGEKFRIDSSGNLLAGIGSGSYHRIVKNNSTGSVLEVSNTANTSGDACLSTVLGANCNNTSSYHLSCWTGGTNKAGIYGNGTSYGMSDGRYKTDIETARSYLDDLCATRVVKYKWRDTPESSPELGVIAQELEQIFPGMVANNPVYAERQKNDKTGKPIYEQKEIVPAIIDETGEVTTPAVMGDDLDKPIMEQYLTGETTKSVKYSVFVPMLITAVQELSARVQALEGGQ